VIPTAYPSHNTNGISIGSAIFAQMTAECPYNFTMGHPFPPSKLPLPIGWSGPQFNTWFLGPTRVLDRCSRFCRAHYCDRQTERQTTLFDR